MPLYGRLPRRGFSNAVFKKEWQIGVIFLRPGGDFLLAIVDTAIAVCLDAQARSPCKSVGEWHQFRLRSMLVLMLSMLGARPRLKPAGGKVGKFRSNGKSTGRVVTRK